MEPGVDPALALSDDQRSSCTGCCLGRSTLPGLILGNLGYCLPGRLDQASRTTRRALQKRIILMKAPTSTHHEHKSTHTLNTSKRTQRSTQRSFFVCETERTPLVPVSLTLSLLTQSPLSLSHTICMSVGLWFSLAVVQ